MAPWGLDSQHSNLQSGPSGPSGLKGFCLFWLLWLRPPVVLHGDDSFLFQFSVSLISPAFPLYIYWVQENTVQKSTDSPFCSRTLWL